MTIIKFNNYSSTPKTIIEILKFCNTPRDLQELLNKFYSVDDIKQLVKEHHLFIIHDKYQMHPIHHLSKLMLRNYDKLKSMLLFKDNILQLNYAYWKFENEILANNKLSSIEVKLHISLIVSGIVTIRDIIKNNFVIKDQKGNITKKLKNDYSKYQVEYDKLLKKIDSNDVSKFADKLRNQILHGSSMFESFFVPIPNLLLCNYPANPSGAKYELYFFDNVYNNLRLIYFQKIALQQIGQQQINDINFRLQLFFNNKSINVTTLSSDQWNVILNDKEFKFYEYNTWKETNKIIPPLQFTFNLSACLYNIVIAHIDLYCGLYDILAKSHHNEIKQLLSIQQDMALYKDYLAHFSFSKFCPPQKSEEWKRFRFELNSV